MRRISMLVVLVFAAATSAQAQKDAQGLMWGPAPPVFAAGARMAVLQGDPSKAAMYTVRLQMPNGYRIAPHFHPTDEYVTVIQGTFQVGMGDNLDVTKVQTLPAGGFIAAPANMHHYAIAKGKTVVQVSGMGPFALTYVNPADDPSKKVAARK